jgi:hypothetical protein
LGYSIDWRRFAEYDQWVYVEHQQDTRQRKLDKLEEAGEDEKIK